MGDYLSHLAARTLDPAGVIQPRLASLFEPLSTSLWVPPAADELAALGRAPVEPTAVSEPVFDGEPADDAAVTVARPAGAMAAPQSGLRQEALDPERSETLQPTTRPHDGDETLPTQPREVRAADTHGRGPSDHPRPVDPASGRWVDQAAAGQTDRTTGLGAASDTVVSVSSRTAPPAQAGTAASDLAGPRDEVRPPRGREDANAPAGDRPAPLGVHVGREVTTPTGEPVPLHLAPTAKAAHGSEDGMVDGIARLGLDERSDRVIRPVAIRRAEPVSPPPGSDGGFRREQSTAGSPTWRPDAGPTRALGSEVDGSPALAPVVRVSIGRIEVRAVMPPARVPPQAAPVSSAPTMSLDAYLEQRRAQR